MTHPTPMPTAALPLVDHRIYTIRLRKMGEFVEVFDRLAMPILLQTLGHPLGFWTSQVGPLNQFVHLWAYESLADYERRSQARDAHPDFAKYLAASEHLIVAQETRLIRRVAMKSLETTGLATTGLASADPATTGLATPATGAAR